MNLEHYFGDILGEILWNLIHCYDDNFGEVWWFFGLKLLNIFHSLNNNIYFKMEVLKGTIFGNECDEIKFINMLK